jgi:hypothetical protein
MSDAIVVDKSAAPKPTWWERIKGVVMAIKRVVVAFFAPKPLPARSFYVAARVVAATAGSLAAVAVWSALSASAVCGPLALLVAFAIMVAMLVAAAKMITVEPGTPQSTLI